MGVMGSDFNVVASGRDRARDEARDAALGRGGARDEITTGQVGAVRARATPLLHRERSARISRANRRISKEPRRRARRTARRRASQARRVARVLGRLPRGTLRHREALPTSRSRGGARCSRSRNGLLWEYHAASGRCAARSLCRARSHMMRERDSTGSSPFRLGLGTIPPHRASTPWVTRTPTSGEMPLPPPRGPSGCASRGTSRAFDRRSPIPPACSGPPPGPNLPPAYTRAQPATDRPVTTTLEGMKSLRGDRPREEDAREVPSDDVSAQDIYVRRWWLVGRRRERGIAETTRSSIRDRVVVQRASGRRFDPQRLGLERSPISKGLAREGEPRRVARRLRPALSSARWRRCRRAGGGQGSQKRSSWRR